MAITHACTHVIHSAVCSAARLCGLPHFSKTLHLSRPSRQRHRKIIRPHCALRRRRMRIGKTRVSGSPRRQRIPFCGCIHTLGSCINPGVTQPEECCPVHNHVWPPGFELSTNGLTPTDGQLHILQRLPRLWTHLSLSLSDNTPAPCQQYHHGYTHQHTLLVGSCDHS